MGGMTAECQRVCSLQHAWWQWEHLRGKAMSSIRSRVRHRAETSWLDVMGAPDQVGAGKAGP